MINFVDDFFIGGKLIVTLWKDNLRPALEKTGVAAILKWVAGIVL